MIITERDVWNEAIHIILAILETDEYPTPDEYDNMLERIRELLK